MVTDALSGKLALAFFTTLGSFAFFTGTQYNRIDQLFVKAHAAEQEQKGIKDVIYDIHGKVCGIESDLHNIHNKIDKIRGGR